MYLFSLASCYLTWHYSGGLRDIIYNWRSLIYFTRHFFSFGFLFQTWFSPFGRLNEQYGKQFNAEAFFETLVVNVLMRVVGFFLRTFVIIAGFIVLLLVVILGPVLILLWLLVPIFIVLMFFSGVFKLLS